MGLIAQWGIFTAIIVAMIAFDLFYLVRRAHVVPLREAALWSALWIGVATVFGTGVLLIQGRQDGIEYFTAYLIEKSLSVDNIFVFLVIFGYFAVPASVQPKVLRWGIIGALVMRLIFILSGAALLERFHWMVFVFGALVLFAALRLALQKDREINPERNPIVRAFRRVVPVTPDFRGDRFFTRANGALLATPLLIVLLVIESTDLVFAVDSIPAIFTVTRDPFIIYTSNAFAILGLRALYFVLADLVEYFVYLRQGAVAILGFVGVKMLVSDLYDLPTFVPLAVVGVILVGSIALSILKRRTAPATAGRRSEAARASHPAP